MNMELLQLATFIYCSLLLSMGFMLQDPQRMPETKDSNTPYTYYFFLYVHTHDKV